MPNTVLPDPATPFGARVRERLRAEQVIWLTTTGRDGTPQPNPVWFLLQGETVLIYSRAHAHRLRHIRERPQVALHLDGNGRGGDIIVLTGTARVLDGEPPAHETRSYVDKYRSAMQRVSGGLAEFGAAYPVAIGVEITRVRGF